MVMRYNDFGKNISQVIKDNLSITFSTYNNWNLWKNKMENSKNNNNLQTEIFWEMYRSNKLSYLEKSIDFSLIMKSYRSQVYTINTNVEVTRKKYKDLNGTFESEENIIIPISFKTSDILPNYIIQKPIIYVEYFSGHEYSFNDEFTFNGINKKYLSPLVISINIIPNIIRTEYKVNDYVVFYDNVTQTEKISKVLSVSEDYTYIEIFIFETISFNNTFYIKDILNQKYNAKQDEIYLYSTEYN
jgi:hypothetical protein